MLEDEIDNFEPQIMLELKNIEQYFKQFTGSKANQQAVSSFGSKLKNVEGMITNFEIEIKELFVNQKPADNLEQREFYKKQLNSCKDYFRILKQKYVKAKDKLNSQLLAVGSEGAEQNNQLTGIESLARS